MRRPDNDICLPADESAARITACSARRLALAALLGAFLISVARNTRAGQPPASFQLVGHLTQVRGNPPATLLPDGTVLVTGGFQSTETDFLVFSSAELYDPKTNVATALPPMIAKRMDNTMALLHDGRVLVVGGSTTVEIFDPATRTFTTVGHIPQAGGGVQATVLSDGRVLLAGGTDSNGQALTNAELFDPRTGQIQATGRLPRPRAGFRAVLLPDGRVAMVGGFGLNDPSPRQIDIYDPKTGTFTQRGMMVEAGRVGGAVALLPGSKILMAGGAHVVNGPAGGRPDVVVSDSIEIYDPDTGQSVVTGRLAHPRYGLISVTLADGRVLVAGGYSARDGAPLAAAELIDPIIGTASPTASMNAGRANAPAVLLPEGRALILGGIIGDGAAPDSVEAYVP